MTKFQAVIQTMRPSFLLLPIAVSLLGGALAFYAGGEWSASLFALVVIGAVLSNACVNMLNEVHDARSGLDDLTQRTPFSGGSGALQQNPKALVATEISAYILLVILAALGVWFISVRGWGLLPLGLFGLLLVVAYTPKITRLPWVCLIAPGLGFGPLMVLGTYYVMTGEYSWLAFWVSLIPFFLVNNLLLLNQFPDYAADQQVGRKNILIAYGLEHGKSVFRWFLSLAFVTLFLLVALAKLPMWALLGCLSLVVGVPLFVRLPKLNAHLHQLLAFNVIINLTLPTLIAVGLWLAV